MYLFTYRDNLSPVQGILAKCIKGFIVSEFSSESEQAKGPNPWNEQS
jgi:hypothetical protein